MKPRLTNDWAVQAHCPDCGTLSLFDFKDSSHEFGSVNVPVRHTFDGKEFGQVTYKLPATLRPACATRGRRRQPSNFGSNPHE